MPNPHFKIKISQRSKGHSAVAGAAYQSGETLFSEYDQKRKSYKNKQGILYTEIMLPSHAPAEYADRSTLWNAVEAVENQWNSQLARRFVITFPRELPQEIYPEMAREYCQKYFVDRGMICDFAIHDTKNNNPHAHVMLTMRPLDEQGKWLPKSRKVYDLDESGQRIRLPSGNWKSHKESTVDWNEQYNAEIWRSGWAEIQNKYLEEAGRPERVDLRSYERQGIDQIPTVHMGAAVTQMERRGIETNIGNLNRDIKAANSMMASIRRTIQSLAEWIADIAEATREALAEIKAESEAPTLAGLLSQYLNLRREERRDWSRYGQNKGSLADVQAVAKAVGYLREHNLITLQNLDDALKEAGGRAMEIRKSTKVAESRMKTIAQIQKAVSVCMEHKSVHNKYVKIGWKAAQTVYAERHQDSLDAYNKSFRFLKKQGVDLTVDLDALQAEYDTLEQVIAENNKQLAAVKEELQPLKEVRYWINKVLEPEKEKKPVPMSEQLQKGREQARDYDQRRKAEQRKKQNMER